jgi:gamma-glutamyltranspeptidase / glutathione hydrolase
MLFPRIANMSFNPMRSPTNGITSRLGAIALLSTAITLLSQPTVGFSQPTIDQTVSNRTVSDRTVSNRPFSDQTFSDRSSRGMVTSAHALASQAGVAMLHQGGNAIDAAVATTFAISVVEPFSAGIGGGGFLLLHRGDTGDIQALDFRERAPLAATRDMYVDAQGKVRPKASTDGHLAVAVPGTVAGLYAVHQRYGQLPWATVVAPAQRLAQEGFLVSWRLAGAIANQKTLQANPAGRQIFTRNGQPLGLGDRLVQTDLAKTLAAIAADPQSVYTGTVGRAIVQDMAANRGLITPADLQRYRPIWREPVCGRFQQYRICSMPPPSSGGVHILQILNLLTALAGGPLAADSWHSPTLLHGLIEAMRIAYADRAEYLGDPDFVSVPVRALISPAYAQLRRADIDPQRAKLSTAVKPGDAATIQRLNGPPQPRSARPGPAASSQAIDQLPQESEDTSHLNAVDAAGNAVSLTFTLNLGFGAGVVAAGTGIVLNNEMDDFAIAPNVPNAFGLVGRDANAIAPGKTPLSSMSPTIVTVAKMTDAQTTDTRKPRPIGRAPGPAAERLRLVVGAPGGSTIITTVLQIVLNVLVYEMPVARAVAAPRLHHQWLPDRTWVDRWGFDPLTVAELRRRGHTLVERDGWGNANAIVRRQDGVFEGAADPRGEGVAIGF